MSFGGIDGVKAGCGGGLGGFGGNGGNGGGGHGGHSLAVVWTPDANVEDLSIYTEGQAGDGGKGGDPYFTAGEGAHGAAGKGKQIGG